MKLIIYLIIVLVALSGCNYLGTGNTNKDLPVGKIESEDRIDTALRLTKDVFEYIEENDKELTRKLDEYHNGTIDKVTDLTLEIMVTITIDYLTSELTMEELEENGLDGILWQLYDIDDVLNSKDVEIIVMEERITVSRGFSGENPNFGSVFLDYRLNYETEEGIEISDRIIGDCIFEIYPTGTEISNINQMIYISGKVSEQVFVIQFVGKDNCTVIGYYRVGSFGEWVDFEDVFIEPPVDDNWKVG